MFLIEFYHWLLPQSKKAETNAHNAKDSGPNVESIICCKYYKRLFMYQAEIIIIISIM